MRKRKSRFKTHIVTFSLIRQYITIGVLVISLCIFVIHSQNVTLLMPDAKFLLKCMHHSVLSFQSYEKKDFNYSAYDVLANSILSIHGSDVMSKKYAAKYGGVLKENIEKKESKKNDEHILESDVSAKGITFINTPNVAVDAMALLQAPLSFSSVDKSPKVLIVHTHTSEAYCESDGARSENQSMNVVGVGQEIANALQKEGIPVVHDTTQNDNPSYNQSYKKALSVIEKNLQAYPSIEVVLDIHRDYIKRDDGTLVKPTITLQNGTKAAQIMFVIGTDHMGLSHPKWRHNLSFAVKIQSRLNELQPGLCRSINIRTERFNQHMTKGSMIIEVGTAANTADEAKQSATLVGKAIAQILKS